MSPLEFEITGVDCRIEFMNRMSPEELWFFSKHIFLNTYTCKNEKKGADDLKCLFNSPIADKIFIACKCSAIDKIKMTGYVKLTA